MLAVRFFSFPSPLQVRRYKPGYPSFFPTSLLSSPSHSRSIKPDTSCVFSLIFTCHAHSKASEAPILYNYLIETLKFPKPKALSTCRRLRWIKTLEKPESVILYLKSIGFSDAHIQCLAYVAPQLLSADVEKTLKPKIEVFQELGLSGLDLGHFISKQAFLLTRSLDTVIRPCIAVIKDVLEDDADNHKLFLVLRRCLWIVSKSPEVRLLPNVEYLKSCGIEGTQLATLFRRQPSIFALSLPKLKELVSRVVELGVLTDSRMLAHGLHSLSCISSETFKRKLGLFKSYGFSEEECMRMFSRSPALLRTSERKIRFGVDFFLNTIELERSLLIARPSVLMLSMEERVVPRYRVLNLLKAKKLLKKEPSFFEALSSTEGCFVEKYIAKFPAEAEELLSAYKAHLLA
ncbi:unnamed protein product [Cuscuta epithymum]|uniref:Uncharacterized protein n=1 Tax=Cuscuta epithymum TaxID=186058 RepID=A0AAV0GFF5_9ASTE|nr:unnamed protein product [Cuscuta epithymum]